MLTIVFVFKKNKNTCTRFKYCTGMHFFTEHLAVSIKLCLIIDIKFSNSFLEH